MAEPPPHTETTVLTERPYCDVCALMGKRIPASVDGRTRWGSSWAYMCEPHFEIHGVGLGLGRGQRLWIDP